MGSAKDARPAQIMICNQMVEFEYALNFGVFRGF